MNHKHGRPTKARAIWSCATCRANHGCNHRLDEQELWMTQRVLERGFLEALRWEARNRAALEAK